MVYQLDFLTPGICPFEDISLKHIRHKPKSRKNPRFLPQRKHRRTMRVENFGFFRARAMTDCFAISLNL